MANPTPAFLSFDVEPDGFQSAGTGWRGYDAWVGIAERLRRRLGEVSGREPTFGWFFRMDPQIAALHEHADFAVRAFDARVHDLADRGDVFGIHVHPLRWQEDRDVWVHDLADSEWMRHCVDVATEAFTGQFGERPVRYRGGGGFIDNALVEHLDRRGFRVDLTLEGGFRFELECDEINTAIDDSPCVGSFVDCSRAPRAPYRPSVDDFRTVDREHGRELVMVPLSVSTRVWERPLWWRGARSLRHRPAQRRARVLHPSREWPSPRFYWDLVGRELQSMKRPYVSLAIRTEPAETPLSLRVEALLDALPDHPVAQRLDFRDPLAVGVDLL